MGGKIDVKHIGQNDKGQMRLSRRAALLRDSPTTATGAPLNPATATAAAARFAESRRMHGAALGGTRRQRECRATFAGDAPVAAVERARRERRNGRAAGRH